MPDSNDLDLAQRLKDHAAIAAAIQRAVREAVLGHARAGHPVAGWQDGKVVWLQPEEILRLYAADGKDGTEDAARDTGQPG
jgi:hypothetical protein